MKVTKEFHIELAGIPHNSVVNAFSFSQALQLLLKIIPVRVENGLQSCSHDSIRTLQIPIYSQNTAKLYIKTLVNCIYAALWSKELQLYFVSFLLK